jgi:hypothetical protein
MARFRGMVHSLMVVTRQIMLLFCGGTKAGEVPEVPWNSIRDDLTNTTAGWSFLDDERSRLPVDGKGWLFERIGQQADVRRRIERAGTETGLNGVEVEKFMASIARVRVRCDAGGTCTVGTNQVQAQLHAAAPAESGYKKASGVAMKPCVDQNKYTLIPNIAILFSVSAMHIAATSLNMCSSVGWNLPDSSLTPGRNQR